MGVPQIEVTFDVDTNGVLNVSAEDRGASGKKANITITNEKGRLSDEDIQKMVNEAKEFEAQDAAAKERVEARNNLESYAYQLKTTTAEASFEDTTGADGAALKAKVEETMQWLDTAEHATKEEFDSMKLELEQAAAPVMAKMHQGAAGTSGAPQDAPGAGPTRGGGLSKDIRCNRFDCRGYCVVTRCTSRGESGRKALGCLVAWLGFRDVRAGEGSL